MENIINLLAIIGGILGCVFVVLVEKCLKWKVEGKVTLVKKYEPMEYLVGIIAFLILLIAVLLN